MVVKSGGGSQTLVDGVGIGLGVGSGLWPLVCCSRLWAISNKGKNKNNASSAQPRVWPAREAAREELRQSLACKSKNVLVVSHVLPELLGSLLVQAPSR